MDVLRHLHPIPFPSRPPDLVHQDAVHLFQLFDAKTTGLLNCMVHEIVDLIVVNP